MIVDTHAHLTDAKLADHVDDVVARARAAGVDWIVTISSDLEDSQRAIAVAERFPSVYATVGVHPHAAASVTTDTFPRLRALAAHSKVVALGETGLDFHYDNSPRAEQRASFVSHLELGAELDLPVVVHVRSADVEAIELIRHVGWTRGVLHCFSGGAALLDAALDLGWYISFAGMVTFPKWESADLLRSVPLDRLLVETDSPYLAPVPYRGRRNEPANVVATAEKVAELRGIGSEELFAAASSNAGAFYRVGAGG